MSMEVMMMPFLGEKWRFVFARFKISGCVENKQAGCRAHKSFAAGFPGNAKELPTSSPKKRNVFLYCEKYMYGTTLTNTSNKTIGDEGITVDFWTIKVHTSN